MDRPRILVVDDEQELRNMVSEFLTKQGFHVVTAQNGQQMRDIMTDQSFELMILDKNMPGEDGFSLARYVREHHQSGIIMLTAASETIDKVIGLEIGADDYMTKPFDLRELHARVNSVLRRNAGRKETCASRANKQFGHCSVDLKSRRLYDDCGDEVTVTAMEFDLIEAFLASPNRVLSRDFLLNIANKQDNDPFDRSIDTRISRLRRKIERDASKPQTIKTVRSVGYIYITEPGT